MGLIMSNYINAAGVLMVEMFGLKRQIQAHQDFHNDVIKLLNVGVSESLAEKIVKAVESREAVKIIAQIAAKGGADYEDILAIIELAPGVIAEPAKARMKCFNNAGKLSWGEFLQMLRVGGGNE